MKRKSKAMGFLITGVALAVGIAISSGIIRNSYVVDEARALQGDVVATFQSSEVVSDTGYNMYQNDDWLLTHGGNNVSGGTNSKNRDSCNLSASDYIKYAGNSDVSASDTAFAIASKKTLGSVGKVILAHNGGSNNTRGSVYLTTSSDGTTYSKVTLTSGTQGATPNASMTYEFSTIGEATYYAIIIKDSGTSGNYRFDNIVVTFYEGAPARTLDSLSVSGTLNKTSYYVGESFDPAGLTITANYDDESSEDVTLECTFSPNPLTAGVTSVTASYTEGEVTKTVNIGGFSVSTRSVTSISVLTNPTKTSYTIGQSFDPTGMKIRAVYNVGPTNDDYVAYTYAPTSAFASLGEKTITITSTENASAVTSLTVNVVDFPEGTYGITSGATTYQNPMEPDSLVINKSDSELPAVSVSNINNVRLFGSPITGSIMIGSGSSTGASFTISLDSNLYVSKVEFIGNDKDTGAAGTATLAVNGVSINFSTINTEDSIVFKPYSNSIDIATSARLWVEEIIITAHTASSSAVDYGTHFLATTADECSSLSVSLGTWNNLKGLYDNADADVQNVIRAANADVGGSDLEKAIARYTFIAEKYGYDDFMDLGIVSGANQFNVIADNKTNIAIIIVVSLIGVSLLVGHRLIYKRKEN